HPCPHEGAGFASGAAVPARQPGPAQSQGAGLPRRTGLYILPAQGPSRERPMTTIKAIRIHDFSGIDGVRHEDIPLPSPGPGEVRVRIHAAGVNPVDWQLTQGINQEFLNRTLPTIPGFEVAGVSPWGRRSTDTWI